MHKAARQEAIIEIIGEKRISRQDELAELLRQRQFEVTQASVSRDLVELGIAKTGGFYAASGRPGITLVGDISISTAGESLIVARCQSGLASAVAVKIDAAGLAEVVGTIAGDDTIFIAVENASTQRSAIEKLRGLFKQQ